jgi:hypothetical protein
VASTRSANGTSPTFRKVFTILTEQDSYYPLLIQITSENSEILEESDGTFQAP